MLLILSLVFGACSVSAVEVSCDAIGENEAPEILDAKYKKCQEEVAAQQKLVQAKEQESASLQRDIKIISAKAGKAKAEIKARDIKIIGLAQEIDKKTESIEDLKDRMDRIKSSTAELIRKTQDLESISYPEIILDGRNLSELFVDLGSFETIESSLKATIDKVIDIKTEEEKVKKDLAEKQANERYTKSLQEIEKRKLDLTEAEKSRILKETKGEEIKYKAVLIEKQTLVNKIRNMILKITGGGELEFPEALRLVRVAENAIGIRAAFVLAILTQESGMDGVIGANQGKCVYNTPWNNSSGTVMSNAQKPSYLAILASLNPPLDPSKTPVSCPISSAGPYGGAIGPSQFMPKTWWDIAFHTVVFFFLDRGDRIFQRENSAHLSRDTQMA